MVHRPSGLSFSICPLESVEGERRSAGLLIAVHRRIAGPVDESQSNRAGTAPTRPPPVCNLTAPGAPRWPVAPQIDWIPRRCSVARRTVASISLYDMPMNVAIFAR